MATPCRSLRWVITTLPPPSHSFAPSRLVKTRLSPPVPTSATRPTLSQHFKLQSHKHPYSTVVVSSPARSRPRRYLTNTLLIVISFTAGSYLALSYAPPLLTSLIMGSIPTNEETLRYEAPDEFSRQIDEHIKNCALAKSLRANPDFTEARPWQKIPPEMKQHNLTAGTLSGPDTVVVPPYVFTEKGGKSMTMILYVGTHLSGHPGIVHGGFLATMLDEGLARCAFPAMPNKVGVTANLTLDYRSPTMAGQFIVLKARTVRAEGRKAWSEGWIEALDDPYIEGLDTGLEADKSDEWKRNEKRKLVEAKALFVEPRHAKVLKSLYRSVT